MMKFFTKNFKKLVTGVLRKLLQVQVWKLVAGVFVKGTCERDGVSTEQFFSKKIVCPFTSTPSKSFVSCLFKPVPRKIFVSLIIFTLAFSPLMNVRSANAAINKQINYQGKLTTSAGVAVTNGTYNMEFKLYTVSSGGSPIWTETRISGDKVQVTSGLFSVMLGEVTALTGVDFNQTLYLGVNIGGTGSPSWDGEMSPRKKLGAVPAAVVSESAINIIGGATGAIPFQSAVGATAFDSTNFFWDDSNNRLGIGTASPGETLSVNGNAGIRGDLYIRSSGSDSALYMDNVGATTTVQLSTNGNSYFTGGNVGIGTNNPLVKLQVAGVIKSTDTTVSSSTITGSLINAGGFGNAGAIFAGGNISTAGSLNITNNNTLFITRDGEYLRAIQNIAGDDQFQTWYTAGSAARRGYFGYGSGSDDTFTLENETGGPIVLNGNHTGNVGIGTFTPDYNLEVEGANNTVIATKDTTNGVVTKLQSLDTAGLVGTETNHDFTIRTNNTERITVASSGGVSLGTSSPLTINSSTASTSTASGSLINAGGFGNAGSAYIGGNLVVGGTSTGLGHSALASVYGTTPAFALYKSNAATNAKIWDFGAGISSGDLLSFRLVNDAVNAATDWLTVERSGITVTDVSFPNGNVGVGTASPGYKLEVTGTAQFNDYVRVTNTAGAQRLLMGNQDSSGVNNPSIIGAANGALDFGNGDSWTGNGGTFTRTLAMYDSGGISVGPTYSDPGAGVFKLQSTTASSSTITGALVVAGGVGVAGNIYAGGFISSGGFTGSSLTLSGTANIIELSSSSTGSPLYIAIDQTANSGGKRWRVGHTGSQAGYGTFDIYNQTDNVTPLSASSTAVTIPLATASTSTASGSLINAGGFGNAGAGYFGGELFAVNGAGGIKLSAAGGTVGVIAALGTGGLSLRDDANNALLTLADATGDAGLLGNLTVSGTGLSTVAGTLSVGGVYIHSISSTLLSDSNGNIGWMSDTAALNPGGVNGALLISSRTNADADVVIATSNGVRSRFNSTGQILTGNLTVSGNVGIGTASILNPAGFTRMLQIGSAGSSMASFQTTANTDQQWDLGVADPAGSGGNDFGLYDATAGLWRMVVQDVTGNVGIGTNTPTNGKFEVQGGSVAAAHLQSTSDAQLVLKGTDNWAGITFSDNQATDNIWYNGGNSTFAIGGGGSNVAGKKLHIDGGVSIGASSDAVTPPANGLYVEGGITAASITVPSISSPTIWAADGSQWDFLQNNSIFPAVYNKDLMQDNLLFFPPYLAEKKVSGSWSSVGVNADLFMGINGVATTITNGDEGYRMVWNNFTYKFFEHLFVSGSANGNAYTVTVETSPNGSTWTTQFTTSNHSDWPGYMAYQKFFTTASDPYLRMTFTPTWNNGNPITLAQIRYFAAYPSDAATKLFTWDNTRNISLAGVLKVPDGSVSAPSLSFVNDTNLGIYRGGTDILRFATAGADRMTIDATGNVGIGTTGPVEKLSVYDGDINVTRIDNTTSKGIYLKTGSTYDWGFRSLAGTSDLTIRAEGAAGEVMTLTKVTGNVGIGTTNPLQILHTNATGNVVFLGESSSGSNTAYAYLKNAASSGTYTVGYGSAGDAAVIASGGSERVRVDSNGNVGIGTASPGNVLTVANPGPDTVPALGSNGGKFGIFNTDTVGGSLKYGLIGGVLGTGNSFLQTQRVDGTATAYNMLLQPSGGLVGIGTTNPGALLQLSKAANNVDLYITNTQGSGQTWSLNSDSSGHFNIHDTATNFLTILPTSGNVGIGTTGPGQKFVVSGTSPTFGQFADANLGYGLFLTGNSGGSGGQGVIGNYKHNGASSVSGGTTADGISFVDGTHFYSNSGLSTGGTFTPTERVTILNSGNVGIGQTAPDRKLYVADTSNSQSTILGYNQGASFTGTVIEAITDRTANSAFNLMNLKSSTASMFLVRGDGNVGIGIASPGTKLEVAGNIKQNFSSTDSDGYSQYSGGIHIFSATRQSNNLSLSAYDGIGLAPGATGGPSTSYALYAKANGYVGIGNTSPTNKLTVGTKISHDGAFDFSTAQVTIFDPNNNGGDTPNGTRDILHLVREGVNGEAYGNMASFALGRFEDVGTASRTQLDIKLSDNGFNPVNTVMSLRTNGNVGIGTASPSTKLHVSGAYSSPTAIAATLESTDSNGYSGALSFKVNPSGGGSYGAGHITAENTNNSGATDGGKLSFWTAAEDGSHTITRRMSIDSGGKVGIGTASPSETLQVSAGNNSVALFGPNSGWSSYLAIGAGTERHDANTAQVISTNGNLHIDSGSDDHIYLGYYAPTDTYINPNGGNVGIGTTGPAGLLHLFTAGTTNFDIDAGAASAGQIRFKSAGVTEAFVWHDNNSNYTGIGGGSVSNSMFIQDAGNLGIGTVSPATKLSVNGEGEIGDGPFVTMGPNTSASYYDQSSGAYFHTPSLMVRNDSSETDSGSMPATTVLYNRNGTDNTGSKLVFANNETSGDSNPVATAAIVSQKVSGSAGAWASGNLKFLVKNSNAYTDVMTLTSGGSVGIGTTAPGKTLEINKNLATNTVGAGEVLRLISDDGNNVGRVTELGFGVGPTGATYAPAIIGAVVTSATGFNKKDIYFATRNAISDTAPSEVMRITSAGNVGIGTTAPAGKLHLYSGSSGQSTPNDQTQLVLEDDTHLALSFLTPNTQTQSIYFGDPQDARVGQIRYDHATDDMWFTTADGQVMTLQNGNVGIGTASPDSSRKLTIAGTGNTAAVKFTDTTDSSSFYVGVFNSYGSGNFAIDEDGVANRFTIQKSTGYVGIGTQSPVSKLSVSSSGVDGTYQDILTGLYSANDIEKNSIQTSVSSVANASGFRFQVSNGGGSSGQTLGYQMNRDSHHFYVSGTESVTVNSSGNVGIGQTTPVGKLDILSNGNATQSNISATAANGAYMVDGAYTPNNYYPMIGVRMNDNNPTVVNAGIYSQFTNNGSNLILGGSNNYGAGIDPSLFIQYDGNVGIGTTVPAHKLSVSGTNWTDIMKVAGSGTSAGIDVWDSGVRRGLLYSDSSGFGLLNNSAAWALRVNQGTNELYIPGNVGIGMTSPSTPLDVVGTIKSQLAGTGNLGGIEIGTTASERPVVNFRVSDDSLRAKIELNDINAVTGDRLGLFAYQNGNVNEVMSLRGAGYVGIGDTTPDFGLDVIVADGSGWAGKFASSDSVNGVLLGTRNSQGSISGITSGGSAATLALNPDGGNVGIGTTIPDGKLQVVGNTYIGDSAGTTARLYLYGNGTPGVSSSLFTSNGNLHIDSAAGNVTYLNYYSGTGGVAFGAGNGSSNANVSAAGVYTGTGLSVGSGTITSGLINGQTISSAANFTGSLSLSDSNYTLYTGTGNTISLSVGTEDWVKLATVGNRSNLRIRFTIGSNNSEEEGEIEVLTTHVTAQAKINVSRQSYNTRLREVRVTGTDGGNKSIYVRVRTSDYAPNMQWRIVDLKGGLVSIDNTVSTPVGGASVMVNGNQITNTNGNFGISGSVMIGTTTSPVTAAHVYGTLTVDAAGQSLNSYSEGIRLGAASDGYSIVAFGADPAAASGSQANQWWIGKHGGTSGFNIYGNSAGDAFHILPAGNIGIGTIAPGSNEKLRIETPESSWGVALSRSGANIGGLHTNSGILNLASNSGGAYVAVANNGAVGIGTTAPDSGSKLQVAGGILTSSVFTGTVGSTGGIDYYSTGLRLFSMGSSGSTKGTFTFLAKGADGSQTQPMIIDASGNVGISTGSPIGVLSVGSSNQWYWSNTNLNTLNTGGETAANGADGWINYRGYADGFTYSRNFNVGDGKGTNIAWFDGANRRVGINNAQSASYTLDVNGDLRSANGAYFATASGSVGIGTAAPGAKLQVGTNAGANGGELWVFNAGADPRIVLGDSSSGGDWGAMLWSSSDDTLRLGTHTGGYALVLNESGNVGIGTASPNYKLDVGPMGGTQTSTSGAGGLIRNNAAADASPYTQARIMIYGGTGVDATNYAYLGYGNDANMRIAYGNTNEGHALHIGEATAYDGTGTFTPEVVVKGGRLGVGTTDPTLGKLEIDGTGTGLGGAVIGLNEVGTRSWYIGAGKTTAGKLTIGSGSGGDALTIDGSGNVGISDTTPDYLLDVAGKVRSTGNMGITGADDRFMGIGTANNALGFFKESGGYTWLAASQDAPIEFGHVNTNSNLIDQDMSSINFTPRMTILPSSGNVGIGRTDPGSKLDILAPQLNLTYSGTIGTTKGSLHISPSTGTNDYSNAITFGANSSGSTVDNGQAGIYVQSSGSYGTKMYFGTTDDYGSGSKARMTILHNGTVGIGTAAPVSALDVIRPGNSNVYENGIRTNRPDSQGQYAFMGYGSGSSDAYFGSVYTGVGAGTYGSIHLRQYDGVMNALDTLNINGSGLVGIGTTNPLAALDVQTANGILRQKGLTTMVTETLSAATTQARRYEIARVAIDYNDWNNVGPIEIELYEKYYSQGLKKKYVVWYGYSSDAGVYLSEVEGRANGNNNFQVTIGSEVTISGDNRYIPIYVELDEYAQVIAVLKTSRSLTNSNPPGIGEIYVNSSPTPTNISDFTADSVVTVNKGFNSYFDSNVGIGTTNPTDGQLHIEGNSDSGSAPNRPRIALKNNAGSGSEWSIQSWNTSGDGDLSFIRNSGSGDFTVPTGNVGIGTVAPDTKFAISGDFDATSALPTTNGNKGLLITKTSGVGSDYSLGDTFGVTFAAQSNDSNDYPVAGVFAKSVDAGSYVSGELQFATHLNSEASLVTRMVIDKSGNVGIGDTTPEAQLTVYGTNAASWNSGLQLQREDGGILNINAHANAGYFRTMTSGMNFEFRNSSDTTTFLIKENGRVGIGETTPNAALDILAANTVTDSYGTLFVHTSTAQAADIGGQISFGGTWIDSNTGPSTFASIAGRKENSTSLNAAGYLSLGTQASGSIIERMRISSTGLVGIGNTSPGELLTLGTAGTTAGTLSLAGGTSGKAIINVAAAAGTPTLTLPTNSGTFLVVNSGSVYPAGDLYFSNTHASNVYTSTLSGDGTNNLTLAGNGHDIILSGGNVGIGTSPSDIFHVNKSGGATVIIGNSDNSASDNSLQFRSAYSGVANGSDIVSSIVGAPDSASGGRLVFSTTDTGGTLTERLRIDASGFAEFTGNVQASGSICANGGIDCADIAELYSVTGYASAGDIMQADPDNSLAVKKAENGTIIGIVSTQPAILIEGSHTIIGGPSATENEGKVAVALSGRVPVKVNGENGNIVIGDKVSLSSVPGVGKKANGNEVTVGVAMNSWSGSPSDTGYVTVFVSKQEVDNTAFLEMDLNLQGIAGMITPLAGSANESFVTAFFTNMKTKIGEWLSDAANGITSIFSDNIYVKNQLCIGATCINETQLKALLEGTPASAGTPSSDTTTNTDSTTSSADTPNQSPEGDGTGQAPTTTGGEEALPASTEEGSVATGSGDSTATTNTASSGTDTPPSTGGEETNTTTTTDPAPRADTTSPTPEPQP